MTKMIPADPELSFVIWQVILDAIGLGVGGVIKPDFRR